MSESGIISELLVPLCSSLPGAWGLEDDAAHIVTPAGEDLIVTTDTLTDGVHFRAVHGSASAASRALRSNLSDLAAMGARPVCYNMALSIPDSIDEDWLRGFVNQLALDQAHFSIALIGGDTTRTPGPFSVTISAFGSVPEGGALRRNGARPGDNIFVSGTLGDGYLGLKLLNGEIDNGLVSDPEFAIEKFSFPVPRIDLGTALRGKASACADVSDGLLRDLGNICRASKTTARIEREALPFSETAKSIMGANGIDEHKLITGGDDYELIFCVPPSSTLKSTTPVTRIGTIVEGLSDKSPVLVTKNGTELDNDTDVGYEHTW